MIEQDRSQSADLNRHDDGDGRVFVRASKADPQGVRDSKIHIPAAHVHIHAPIETATVIHRHIEAPTTGIH